MMQSTSRLEGCPTAAASCRGEEANIEAAIACGGAKSFVQGLVYQSHQESNWVLQSADIY